MLDRTVKRGSYALELKFVLDQYKTPLEMCKRAVKASPFKLEFFPDQYKEQEICDVTVERKAWSLPLVTGECDTHEMRDECIR